MPIVIKGGPRADPSLPRPGGTSDADSDRASARNPDASPARRSVESEAPSNDPGRTPSSESEKPEAHRSANAPASSKGEDKGYKVGPGRPPKEHQWKPKQSGNPAGRPRGSSTFLADLAKILGEFIKISENGRTKTVTRRRGLLTRFVGKALNGDDRAFGRLLPFIVALDQIEKSDGAKDALTPEERKILKTSAARLLEGLLEEDTND